MTPHRNSQLSALDISSNKDTFIQNHPTLIHIRLRNEISGNNKLC